MQGSLPTGEYEVSSIRGKRYLHHPGDPLLPNLHAILPILLKSLCGCTLHKLPLVLMMTPCDALHKWPLVLLKSLCTNQVLLGGLGSSTQHLLPLVHGGQCQRDSESRLFCSWPFTYSQNLICFQKLSIFFPILNISVIYRSKLRISAWQQKVHESFSAGQTQHRHLKKAACKPATRFNCSQRLDN